MRREKESEKAKQEASGEQSLTLLFSFSEAKFSQLVSDQREDT